MAGDAMITVLGCGAVAGTVPRPEESIMPARLPAVDLDARPAARTAGANGQAPRLLFRCATMGTGGSSRAGRSVPSSRSAPGRATRRRRGAGSARVAQPTSTPAAVARSARFISMAAGWTWRVQPALARWSAPDWSSPAGPGPGRAARPIGRWLRRGVLPRHVRLPIRRRRVRRVLNVVLGRRDLLAICLREATRVLGLLGVGRVRVDHERRSRGKDSRSAMPFARCVASVKSPVARSWSTSIQPLVTRATVSPRGSRTPARGR